MKLKDVEVGTVVIYDGEEFEVVGKTKKQVELENGQKVAASKLELAEAEFEGDDSDEPETMSAHLRKYRPNYGKVKSYTGSDSLSNQDPIAVALAGLSPKQVCQLAEQIIHECPDLQEKYANLNPGQIRMNAGNRIRAAIKRGDNTQDEFIKAAKKMPKPQVVAPKKESKKTKAA